MTSEYRGSQKHLLDLLDRKTERLTDLCEIVSPSPVAIKEGDVFRPSGREDPKESYLPQFCKEFCEGKFDFSPIVDWWVPSQWRPPTWDLISTCTVNGKYGILLVEAKAHKDEFDCRGKILEPTASIESQQNHQQIVECLNEANVALNDICDGEFNLSVDTHYQLANRVAHLWKLATCGIPVVLLYLGFVGDTEIRKTYFQSDKDWQKAMGDYMQGLVPPSFLNQQHDTEGGGTMLMLSRSREILEKSSPR